MKLVFTFSCLLFLIGCFERKQCSDSVKIVSAYKSGATEKLLVYSCADSISEKLITFYETGDTNLVFSMLNEKHNGPAKKFYKSKKIAFEGYYKNDSLQGKCIWYYENGVKKYEQTFENGRRILGVYKYYENGGIEMYEFYDVGGQMVHQTLYSPTQNVELERGGYTGKEIKNKSKYSVGDSLICIFPIATPPGDSIVFSIAFYQENDTPNWNVIKINNSEAIFSTVLNTKGDFWLDTKVEVYSKGEKSPKYEQRRVKETVF